jgi:homoserine O-acetyltransferase/O-succinyltransferase
MTVEQQIHYFGASKRQVMIGRIADIATKTPLKLKCATELYDIPIAYQTYGTLNEQKSNAILICHALTGDQYVASGNPVTGKAGWWHFMVGAGKPIDTDRFFVVCSNVLGGCMGSFGPKNTKDDGAPYGLDFPVVTVGDMVNAQKLLIESFGIEKLFAVIGGSMGGMQVLQWASTYPTSLYCAIPLATTSKHNAQNIAYHEIGRQAIMADPQWYGGRYYDYDAFPVKGLSVARMTAHVTYLSEQALQRKFGRMLQAGESPNYSFEANFQVESYLRHQGVSFVERFDPNSYLYITKAADYFDLSEEVGGSLSRAFAGSDIAFCVMSFSTDWLYPTSESRDIVRALNATHADVSFTEIESPHGHDAFLLPDDNYMRVMSGFLDGKARGIGV